MWTSPHIKIQYPFFGWSSLDRFFPELRSRAVGNASPRGRGTHLKLNMGNSSGKASDEPLRGALRMLLEGPMVGPAAAAAAAAAATGGAGDGSADQARAAAQAGEEAAAAELEAQEEIWMGIFGDSMEEEEFFEAFSAADATAMRVLQPGNLKLLAREALSNISRFMESRQTSPPEFTVHASVRVLTRVFPALLSDPGLRNWCWRRRSLSHLLSYLENQEDTPKRNRNGHQNHHQRQQQQQQQLLLQQRQQQQHLPRGRFPAPEEGLGRTSAQSPSPSSSSSSSPHRPRASSGEPTAGGAREATGSSSSSGDAGINCKPYEGVVDGGEPDADGVADNFPVCFASVALHAATNLLSFPGFCVDDEAADWDDYYTPIPALHYGIREASIIWAPGVAVTEHNMRQVSSLDSNRVEVLRLLASMLSLPLFLDTPSTVSFRFLFYSLLNLAVVGRALDGVDSGGGGGMRWLGFGGGGGRRGGSGGERAGMEGAPQSLTEWSLQLLALLLRHGRPYEELLQKRGVDLAASGIVPAFGSIPRPVELSAEMANGYNCFRRCVFVVHSDDDLGAIALGLLRHMDDVRLRKTRPQGSVLSIHPETLMIFAAFVHENPRFVPRLAASQELVRATAVSICHFLEAVVATMMEEEAEQQQQQQQKQQRGENVGGSVDRDGGSEEEAGGGGENRTQPPLGEEVWLLVLLSRLLLKLSENERFMATLVDILVRGGGGGGRGVEFSALEMDEAPGTTMIDMVLALSVWTLARGGKGGAVAAPALAAVARNACPFLTAGMRRPTAEWMLDALELYLDGAGADAGAVPGTDDGDEGAHHAEAFYWKEEEKGRGGRGGGGGGGVETQVVSVSSSLAVASLLLEGLATAVVFHHEEQAELVLAMVYRSRASPAVHDQQQQDGGGGGGGGGVGGVGVFRWLAARGGMIDSDGGRGGCGGDGGGTGCYWRGGPAAVASLGEGMRAEGEAESPAMEHCCWFECRVASAPWEGWPMRRVLCGGGGSGGSGDESFESLEQERASEVRALAAFARSNVLRPSGLCPPWDDDGDDSSDEGGGGDGDGDGDGLEEGGGEGDARRPNAAVPKRSAHVKRRRQQQQQQEEGDGGVGYMEWGAAAITGAFGYFTSTAPRNTPTVVDAEAAEAEVQARQDSGREVQSAATIPPFGGAAAAPAVSDVGLVEEGGGGGGGGGESLHPSSGNPGNSGQKSSSSSNNGGGVSPPTQQRRTALTQDVRAGIVGGGGGFGESVGVLTRVLAVEEPWQSIYLWSLLFIKTTADLRLFDSRTVRLFEVMEETDDSDLASPSFDEGTEVDDDEYYQEAFFPGEEADLPSDPEEEQGGFMYSGGRGGRGRGGGGGSGGAGRSGSVDTVTMAEEFQEEVRADSLV
ncbi:unnamed protein product [Pylaiella littoralis]